MDIQDTLLPVGPEAIPLIASMADSIWRAHYVEIIGEAQVDYMLQRMYAPETLSQNMADGQQFFLIYNGNSAAKGFIAVSVACETRSGFIHKFYIANDTRGKGLGARAFADLLGRFSQVDAWRLYVNRANYKSVNFYFKMGFRIERCLCTDIGEGYVMDDFLMIRPPTAPLP
ncbi:MAG: GNAT family N-acetyltransferase [Saprospiraceae bacterium]